MHRLALSFTRRPVARRLALIPSCPPTLSPPAYPRPTAVLLSCSHAVSPVYRLTCYLTHPPSHTPAVLLTRRPPSCTPIVSHTCRLAHLPSFSPANSLAYCLECHMQCHKGTRKRHEGVKTAGMRATRAGEYPHARSQVRQHARTATGAHRATAPDASSPHGTRTQRADTVRGHNDELGGVREVSGHRVWQRTRAPRQCKHKQGGGGRVVRRASKKTGSGGDVLHDAHGDDVYQGPMPFAQT
ncbi:uncharacterized protein B0H18DRAFT_1029463 [Fomitopsis serialis]|uniref:uncharacterized protein n=1 Tax=Fomitopsis serialis TaxID=139415 RepID=UPI00200817AA|nr:uncharacterized protein B0H18DRAFT_1029463 [Neoantrodia serialis]KAH9919035.1 hypothetical protein B0H18DRAFT_1029463 [Neoantrodia serialis]